MSNQTIDLKRHSKSQRGVVLFIALMALVVMSIAAVALIRSVDTNTSIAGNLSFQQSALVSASLGVESAMTQIRAMADGDATVLHASNADSAYYATNGNLGGANLNLEDIAVLKNDTTWKDHSALAAGDGIIAGIESDTKNQINYIIERMCSVEGVEPGNPIDNSQNCLLGDNKGGGGSKGVKTAEGAGSKTDGEVSAIYRVTIRVAGLKNTRSYSQIFVY